MPPPMIILSTLSSMFLMSWILSLTLAPPRMASTGFSGASSTFANAYGDESDINMSFTKSSRSSTNCRVKAVAVAVDVAAEVALVVVALAAVAVVV